jgi:hypothetical protein
MTLRPWRRVRQSEVPEQVRNVEEEMMEKITDIVATTLTADAALDDLIFSWILDRETELAAEIDAGLLMDWMLFARCSG